MHLQYIRNFAIGTSTHIVRAFDNYTDEQGLADQVDEIETTRLAEVLKYFKGRATTQQLDLLWRCMREKSDVIILADGRIGR